MTISASAANIYVQTWRLIDAGGHLDWSDEGTKYLSQWKSAVNMWNDYKPGVIREDTGSTINDVEISDVYEKIIQMLRHIGTLDLLQGVLNLTLTIWIKELRLKNRYSRS